MLLSEGTWKYSTEKKFFRRAQDNSEEKSFEFWRVFIAGGVAEAHVLTTRAWLPAQPPSHPGVLSMSPAEELKEIRTGNA